MKMTTALRHLLNRTPLCDFDDNGHLRLYRIRCNILEEIILEDDTSSWEPSKKTPRWSGLMIYEGGSQ